MKKAFLVLLVLVLKVRAHGQESLFQELQIQFQKSSAPSKKEPLGYWAGYCVCSDSPEHRMPAVYLSTMVVDTLSAHTEKDSQTYFWENTNDPDFFMSFSVKQLVNYSPFSAWVEQEQWLPTTIEEGSLTNFFQLKNGETIVRSVRWGETEAQGQYLMQVTHKTKAGSEIFSYCSFNKAIKD